MNSLAQTANAECFRSSAETRRIHPACCFICSNLMEQGHANPRGFGSNCCRKRFRCLVPAMAALRTPSLGPIRGALDLPAGAQCVSEWVERHRALWGGCTSSSIGISEPRGAMDPVMIRTSEDGINRRLDGFERESGC